MENYIVSARKYRPSTFESVIGQQALTTTLKNAIASGKLAHAYLFCGPRGVGKTTCARIFAKTINCQHPTSDGEACNQCESCQAFNEQRSYNIFELDAASNNSVEGIRSLIEEVRIPPQIGKYKVYIIDEVHMLSTAAFNAFLKTLEEPPRHAVFILATTEKQKLLPTILSRCQIYDFNRISVQDIVNHLQRVADKEGVKVEPEALMVIAQKADGGMRDALSIFDQVVSFTRGNITYQAVIDNLNVLDYEYYFKLTDMFLSGQITDALLLFNSILQKGFDGNHFITGLASHFRDLLVSKDESTLPLLEVSDSVRWRYSDQAGRCPTQFLFRGMKICNDCDLNYRISKNKRLLVELTLIECAQLGFDTDSVSGGQGLTTQIKPIFQPTAQAKSSTSKQAPKAVASHSASQPVKPSVHHSPFPEKDKSELQAPVVDISSMQVSIRPEHHQKIEQKSSTHESALPVQSEEEQNESFTLSDLDLAWRSFAAQLPREQKANSRKMMGIHPTLSDPINFEVSVDNDMAAESLQELAGQIETFMHAKLHNSHVKMHIRVAEVKEQHRVFTGPEKLRMMMEKNPYLKELKDTLGLELA
ncbi:MAG: DNA polymerase III subunit gamma/tau [Phocaeicola sp.]|uniref:DNA polymerase III subunit gamma/tau n=1 Tax=Phocaeicola sp. TaxID=2773926 RepID=UPI003F9F2D89